MIHILPYAGQHLPNGRTWMNNLDLESGNSGYIKITVTIVFINMKVSGFLFCTMQNWHQLYVVRIGSVNILKCWFGPGFDSVNSVFTFIVIITVINIFIICQHPHNVLTFIKADTVFPLGVISRIGIIKFAIMSDWNSNWLDNPTIFCNGNICKSDPRLSVEG